MSIEGSLRLQRILGGITTGRISKQPEKLLRVLDFRTL